MSNHRWQTEIARPSMLVSPWREQLPASASGATPTEKASWERAALAVLERPLDGESSAVAHERKEAELKSLFATLTIAESRALHRRLASMPEGDELAASVARLIPARRARLLAFVADARRREAIARSRERAER